MGTEECVRLGGATRCAAGPGGREPRSEISPRPPSPPTHTVAEWLDSPYLARVASRVADQYGVPIQDVQDLLQDLRLALWKAGPELIVNRSWVFHTANHKAIDLIKRKARLAEEALRSNDAAPSPAGVDPALPRLLRARAGLLPQRLHNFYQLRYEEGLSEREIAKRLGLCRGSVRYLDRRCLRMMKGRLTALIDRGREAHQTTGPPESQRRSNPKALRPRRSPTVQR